MKWNKKYLITFSRVHKNNNTKYNENLKNLQILTIIFCIEIFRHLGNGTEK